MIKTLFLFCLLSPFSMFSQFPTEGYNITNPVFLDPTIHDYDVFFIAEMHFRNENISRKKKMIEYLASKNSIDVIVVERSYGFGYWVNDFLKTGDSLALKEYLQIDDFFSTINGVVYDDEYNFYKWLRRFNMDNNLSIKVIGIDLRGFWNEKPILWSFLKFVDQNPDIAVSLEASVRKAQHLIKKNKVSTRAILNWVDELEAAAGTLDLKDKGFVNFIFNLKQSIQYTQKKDLNYRDGQIAANFLRYIEKGQKVYGQYGLTHIALKNGERIGWNTFGSILNQNTLYENRILSIGLICIGCDPDSKDNPGEFPGSDIFHHFLTQDDFDRLKPEFIQLPTGTFVDLRGTDEKIKEYCQLLLVEYN